MHSDTTPSPKPGRNIPQFVYERLVKINDSPQKIALGFALGVFLGIFPGAGPMASVVLSSIFRINSIAALTGSLLTNTWISVVTFAFAVKAGAYVTGADWQKVFDECKVLIEQFTWKSFFDVSLLKIVCPLMIGYILVGLFLALLTYLLVLGIFKFRKAR